MFFFSFLFWFSSFQKTYDSGENRTHYLVFSHYVEIHLGIFDSDLNLGNLPGEMHLLEVTLWYSHSCSERLREEQNQ